MKLLLLAGTGEARRIADRLARAGVEVIASLAGVTRAPETLAVPTRTGGFGGADGFRRFLDDERIGAVLDATHPFAVRISTRTAKLCGEAGLPYCQVLRPEWTPGPGDNWVPLADEAEAAAHVPEGATVFLATGRQTLERFENLSGRRLICRVVDAPEAEFPFENGEFLVGKPPFSADEEAALFERLGIDWLIVKNAGGEASRAKLDAARRLGLGVGMIRRPAQPEGMKVRNVDEAVAWVTGLE